MTIEDTIARAKRRLEDEGVIPKFLWMSPIVHQWLVDEINRRDGGKHKRVFEIYGLRVLIEDECPSGAAYISGE